MRRSLIIFASCLAACHEAPLKLAIPHDPDAATIVVGLELAGQLEVFVLDSTKLDAPELPTHEEADSQPLSVTTISYDKPLSALRMRAGPLPAASASSSSAIGLPAPTRVWRLVRQVGDKTDGGWQLGGLDSALTGFSFEPTAQVNDPCVTLSSRPFPLESEDEITAATAIDSRSVLIATSPIFPAEPEFFAVTATGAEKLPIAIPNFTPWAAVRAPNGELWLSGGGGAFEGQLWRGSRSGFARSYLRGSPNDQYFARALVWSGATLYLETDEGALESITGEHWQLLRDNEPNVGPELRAALVTGGEPGLVYGLAPYTPGVPQTQTRIRTIRGSTVSDQRISSDFLMALAYVPAVGLIGGDDKGAIQIYDGQNLRPLGSDGLDFFVTSIVPFRQGFLFSGYNGVVHQWQPGAGFCAESISTGLAEASQIVVTDQVIVVAGLSATGSPNYAVVLTPAPE